MRLQRIHERRGKIGTDFRYIVLVACTTYHNNVALESIRQIPHSLYSGDIE